MITHEQIIKKIKDAKNKIMESLCFYCVHRDGQFRILGKKKIVVNCSLAKYPVCRTMKKHQCKDYDKIKNSGLWELGRDFIE